MLSIIALTLFFLVLAAAGYLTLGYPLLTALIALWHPAHAPVLTSESTVSVLIPCYNEAEVIADKIQAVLSLEYPRQKLQIIVADDGSSDETAQIARQFETEGITILSFPERRGKVTVMNEALEATRGEIVVFTDADVFCPSNSLQLIMRHFCAEDVGCVTAGHRIIAGDSQAGKANDLYWRYESTLKTLESRIYTTVAASGHMLAVRRDLIEPLPPEVIVDDFYRALTILRQGYRVIYEPGAVCLQRPVTSMADEITRRQRINAGRFQVIQAMRQFLPALKPMARFQVISHKLGRPFLPLLMLLALILTPLAIILPGWGAVPQLIRWFTTGFFVIQVVFYTLALLGYLLDRVGIRPRILSLPYYLVSANLGALLGLVTYLRGRQTVLWDQARRA